MISPQSKDKFMENMKKSEKIGDYSEPLIDKFYRWMFRNQDGVVQTCVFPVPPENKDVSEMGEGKWIHARTYNEFEEFCRTYSGVWRYHVYAGVNTLDAEPKYGRGSIDDISRIRKLCFDIELKRESYGGSTKEEVWWAYRYALAEVKYMNERYGVWPLVAMSENGIHLHFNVDFECKSEYLHQKQHIYSKHITQNAMDNKYVDTIKSNAPDHITFDQDDVSDPARVMKVPGTTGVKSDTGRLCAIIHMPTASDAGTITESDIQTDIETIKSEVGHSNNNSTSSASTSAVKNVDTTKSSLQDELEDKLKRYIRKDASFAKFCVKDESELIDEDDDKPELYDSRSELEFAFVVKMLKHGFTESEIVDVMWNSEMSKWREESSHYRERTVSRAIDYFDGQVVKDSREGSHSFSRE